uniref:Uncharacterized protein n=1 Tax=mine drainage metagenome TaxID=410659 RepID=E6QP73_9ZZZZ
MLPPEKPHEHQRDQTAYEPAVGFSIRFLYFNDPLLDNSIFLGHFPQDLLALVLEISYRFKDAGHPLPLSVKIPEHSAVIVGA